MMHQALQLQFALAALLTGSFSPVEAAGTWLFPALVER